ncbi:adenylate kinase [Gammaproteobacteria bacterium]|nr:adenylate kinase [Gammaproteobacteria bacterium]MDA8925330.1 adenylate kinase [Gammaproteobacteria bacterium]MDA9365186.1 adenylate kinase [Gammaproteobacteria bacterium]MDB9700734.1 adenylate kinase [Gammaproteobacteria bacterium]MDC0091482.1 adenylate kinase [Gammaproteobacteria bacterium]
MKKLLLIGPPGAGKGTQADLICSSLKIPKISTGDMLRAAIASGNELGQKVSSVMKSGSLVSDEIIIELISDRISQPDCGSGFLFDGCIRTAGQADLCVQNNIEFTHVIEINVVDEIIVNRMSGRRVHPGSGRNYHLIYQPPRHDGLDDETGEPLIQREDDLPDTVKHRLNVYHEETKPLVEYYQEKSTDNSLNYVKVDGSMEVQKVFEAIKKHF